MKIEQNKIYCGNCSEIMKTFPSESIDMVMTSPPYWALRDYGTATWKGGDKECDHIANPNATKKFGNPEFNINRPSREKTKTKGYYKNICPKCGAQKIDKQFGLEPTFQEYINKLCDIFDEVKRVLKKKGTCWVNMGDTYSGSGKGAWKNKDKQKEVYVPNKKPNIFKEVSSKCLCQIPSRFAIEMTNRGWILRNRCIWHKPNCMPSSAKDRFTVDYEDLFFFTKSKRYYFEQQREALAESSIKAKTAKLNQTTQKGSEKNAVNVQGLQERGERFVPSAGRNKRAVWSITTKGFPEAHFAVYPEKLCETPILAGCPKKGIVLDPFFGAGTTGLVAQNLSRNWIGIELNPEYIKIAKNRLKQKPLF